MYMMPEHEKMSAPGVLKTKISWRFLTSLLTAVGFLIAAPIAAANDVQESAPAATDASTTSTTEAREEEVEEERNPFVTPKIEFAKPDPVLGLIDSRDVTSLNGEWNIITDPMGVGNPGGFFGGFTTGLTSKTGMELIEYNFEDAEKMRVPGDWNSQKERLFFYQGQLWYYKKINARRSSANRQHLYFGGANFTAQVFLNGKTIGEHKGGYVPFSFDVTDTIKDGENVLIVKVDNRLSDDSVPTLRTDWWPYGGLTRDVALIETPRAYIRNAKASLKNREQGTIDLQVETVGMKSGATVKVSIPELRVNKNLRVGTGGKATGQVTAQPQLWTPENPKLYDVRFSAGKDTVSDRIGFRTIETKGTQILLNGKPIKLRGISTHEEPIGEAGAAYSKAHYERLLQEAKTMNANFVRAAHYPYSRHMAKAADEMGVMLWEEVPVYWNIAWENPETLSIARDQIARLVQRDWNRASVIIWSVANETPLSKPRMTFLRRLIDDVREQDSSRLVTAALLGGGVKKFEDVIQRIAARGLAKGGLSPKDEATFKAILARAGENAPSATDGYTLMIDDPLGQYTDIVSYNEYFGWYYSGLFSRQIGVGEDVLRPLMLELMADMKIQATDNKPVHISEFGAGAKAGNKGGEAKIWTEEYQAKVYQAQIKMLAASPTVQGMTPWILKDFRAMLRPLAGIQDYYNRKGLVDPNGVRKEAFGIMADFYAGPWATTFADDAAE